MSKRTDTERLDYLEGLNARSGYTGRYVLRMSAHGHGWRLHETERNDGVKSVREAIDRFIDDETLSGSSRSVRAVRRRGKRSESKGRDG